MHGSPEMIANCVMQMSFNSADLLLDDTHTHTSTDDRTGGGGLKKKLRYDNAFADGGDLLGPACPWGMTYSGGICAVRAEEDCGVLFLLGYFNRVSPCCALTEWQRNANVVS